MSASSLPLRNAVLSTSRTLVHKGGSALPSCGRRTMTTSKGKKEFQCILPDNPNILDIRKQVKAIHYAGVKPLVESGRLIVGGTMAENNPVEGETALVKGSMIVYTGESADDVREIINKDIYSTSSVWDLEKALYLSGS